MKTLSTTSTNIISKEDLLNTIISKQSANASACDFCIAGGND